MDATIPRLMSKMAAAKAIGIDRSTLEANFIQTGRVTVYRFGPRGSRIDFDELLEAMRRYGQEHAEANASDESAESEETA